MDNNVFDNSNIAESYAGTTTPLTFSFVQYVYQEVYQHFSKMMGVNTKTIKKHEKLFHHMVEMVGYRIFYNLNSWHRMLTLFPGYQFSAELMEMMMGVEKRNVFTHKKKPNVFLRYFFYLPKAILHTFFIVFTFFTLGLRVKRFNKYFEKTFSELTQKELGSLNLVELKDVFKKADEKLLTHWRVPIANDFAVMISTGVTEKLFNKWFPDKDAYEYIRILTDDSKTLVTLDPGDKLKEISDHIKQDDQIQNLFLSNDSAEHILKTLRTVFKDSQTNRLFDEYLQSFGTRMPNELKLESETIVESPEILIKLIRGLLATNGNEVENSRQVQDHLDLGELGLAKKIVLGTLLKWSRVSVQRREEARFCRTLIFGHIRNIFLSIGTLFVKSGTLKSKRDIFYLTIEEIFSIIDGKELSENPSSLINRRKKEHKVWKNIELPRRIETIKSAKEAELEWLNKKVTKKHMVGSLKGRVASRPNGMVSFVGTALTLEEFDPTADFTGKVLVTRQTDPGWTVIFPLLKGVIVERGGMLSHAAIVARELNIPCVVGVESATKVISNGVTVELDMQNGLVQQT